MVVKLVSAVIRAVGRAGGLTFPGAMDSDLEAAAAEGKDVVVPAPHPPELRARAVELARLQERPAREIAQSLGISESCLRNWMAQADIDAGEKPGLTSDERHELAELRRDKRRLELENETSHAALAPVTGALPA